MMGTVDLATPRSGVTFVLALVVALAAFRYGHDVVKLAVEAPFIDFGTFYTYTSALLVRADPFDPPQLARIGALLTVRHSGTPPTFTPPGYLLFVPFTAMPYRGASLTWLALGQGFLLVALLVWRRCVVPAWVFAFAGVFVMLTYQPIFEDIALGNVNLILLLLVTLGVVGHAGGKSVVAAALPLSWAVHLKPHYVLLIPFLYWVGSPLAAALTLVLAGTWFGLAVVVFGYGWIGGYVQFLSGSWRWVHSWAKNISPHAILHRLFRSDGPSVPIEVLALAVVLVIIFGVMRVTRGAAEQGKEAMLAAWAVGLAALPLVSPLMEEHHLVVLLIPLLFVIARADRLRTWSEMVFVIAAAVLLGSRYSIEAFPKFSGGLLSLAYGGKALGAAALAIVAGRLAHRIPGGEGSGPRR